MPRTEEANRQIRDERQRQILNIAAEVFARKGLAETRISDIAEAGGISQGLIYRYFASKEELFRALIERTLHASVIDLLQAVVEGPGTPWEKLSRITSQMWEGMQRRPAHAHVILLTLTSEAVPADLRALAQDHARKAQALFRRLIAEGQERGEIVAGDPDELTLLYGALIQGLAVSVWFMDERDVRPSIDSMLRILKP
jgi:AcrR family transcriptional regulator